MRTRKIMYTCAGVFNCVIGGFGCFLGLLMLLVSKLIRNMFKTSNEYLDELVTSLAQESSDYEYLLEASQDEVVSFIMRIVFIFSAVLIVLGLIWIAFGVFNLLLTKRHYSVFGRKPRLKVWFIVGSWLLLTLNVANILTTIAVFKKDKGNVDVQEPLYSSKK